MRRALICLILTFNLFLLPSNSLALQDLSVFILRVSRIVVDSTPSRITTALIQGNYPGAIESTLLIFKSLFKATKRTRPQETIETRTLRVAAVQISPRKLTAYTGERVSLSAIGLNSSAQVIQGAKISWSSSNPDKLQIDDSAQATLIAPGLVWVTASTTNASARVPVLVKPGPRPEQTDLEYDLEQSLLREDGSIIGSTDDAPAELRGLLASRRKAIVAVPRPQSGGGDSGDFLYDELWSEPRNLVGSPRNRAIEWFRQPDLAHFDHLIWPTPSVSKLRPYRHRSIGRRCFSRSCFSCS